MFGEKEKRKETPSNLRAWIISILVILALILFLRWFLAPILVPDEPFDSYPQTPQVLATEEAE